MTAAPERGLFEMLQADVGPTESILANGSCADITHYGLFGMQITNRIVVTDRMLRWGGPRLSGAPPSLPLDSVTGIAERTEKHRYAIALDHAPIARLGTPHVYTMMIPPPGGEERILEYTRSEFLFSRPDTDAAVALREQLRRRGVEKRPYVASRWFLPSSFRDGVIRITEPHVDEFLRANMYLVRGSERDLLVDSGLGLASLRDELEELFERPVVAVATHRHFDHVGGLFEFDEVVVHRDDAAAVADAEGFASVAIEDYPPEELSGYEPPERLLTALPRLDFDAASYTLRPVAPTRVVEEGDVIDLGDRRFTVLHLPGHTPGEIGLLDEATRELFSGDAVYESGVLLDELPESDIPDYVQTMRRLRDLDVEEIYGGHDGPFGRRRLHELVDGYLERRA